MVQLWYNGKTSLKNVTKRVKTAIVASFHSFVYI